jgi:hypothetical protein
MSERERERAEIVDEVAERVALLNEFRTDDFQDEVVRLVSHARELWRDSGGELPRRGADPLLDALNTIADVADSSPIAVRDACAAAMRRAGEGARVAG